MANTDASISRPVEAEVRYSTNSGQQSVVSFEVPVITWAYSTKRFSFDLEECWRELGEHASVTRNGAVHRMVDINDLVDAVYSLVSLGIADYDAQSGSVKLHPDRLETMAGVTDSGIPSDC